MFVREKSDGTVEILQDEHVNQRIVEAFAQEGADMLGNLAHFRPEDRVAPAAMPELERLMLDRLAEVDAVVRRAYGNFDYKRIFAALNQFLTVDTFQSFTFRSHGFLSYGVVM